MNQIKKYIAEFIGTFAIVFGGCGAVVANQISNGAVTHPGIAVSFGLIVMTMIYALGHISGAHFNPAVTLAFALKRHFPTQEILPYILAQVGGAIFASFLHVVLLSNFYDSNAVMNLGVTQPADGVWLTAFGLEFILTFFLMFVIMAVATDFRAVGQMAGIAIGGTVLFEAMFAGPLCGASMNPARSLGPALISMQLDHITAYILGPISGAVVAAITYSFIRCDDASDSEVKGCC